MHASKPRVFVTRRIAEPTLTRLSSAVGVDLWPEPMPPPHDELARRLKDADGVLSMLTDRIDADTIASSPRLRVISNLAVGVDNIDLGAASARNIAVGHTPGVLTETTADLAFALMMAVARRIVEAHRYVAEGRWKTWAPDILLGYDLFGATLGIIGWGVIGQAMGCRAAGFQMKIAYTRRAGGGWPDTARAHQASLDDLLRDSDFVSIHAPLTEATRRMIGRRELGLMKPGAILINTARGAIVDHQALRDALASGHLGGAGLDVTDPEPLSPDDLLLRMPNVIVTPHIGSASHATRLKMTQIAADNLLAGLQGKPMLFCANPEIYRSTTART